MLVRVSDIKPLTILETEIIKSCLGSSSNSHHRANASSGIDFKECKITKSLADARGLSNDELRRVFENELAQADAQERKEGAVVDKP